MASAVVRDASLIEDIPPMRTVTFAIAVLLSAGAALAEEPAAKAVETAPTSGKDVGARYGQALGATEICIGSKITDKAMALEATFTGKDLEDFKAQAAKVFQAWDKVKACSNAKDPNQCKIIMDRSCESAVAEIGPTGSALPGLIEPPPTKP
jgi:hypothetical protein